MPYIEIKDYTKKINSKIVLDNINLELDAGKIYGLIGKNGSGKTMLIRAISGLITPNSGKAVVNGVEVGAGVYPKHLGLVIENITMFENLSALKNLKMLNSISPKKISDDDIGKWLEKFDLDPKDSKPIKKYSLGMKQKVSVIQAFMNEPDLIIFDEPTNALDDQSVELLMKTIKEVNKTKGTTFLIASHDKDCIKNISNDIVEMRGGRIVQ